MSALRNFTASKGFIHPITSRYSSCMDCGLPVVTCICSKIPKLRTSAQLWILSTEKEFSRPSNTARLLKLANPEFTDIYLWERTREPKALLEKLRSGIFDPYLLFPAENDALSARSAVYKSSGKVPAFVLIDGTWQEARKIMRKSEYLKCLPLISLDPDSTSAFSLRRGVKPGNLCTLETAISVLRLSGELEAAEGLNGVFKLFMRSYKAGACGHQLRE